MVSLEQISSLIEKSIFDNKCLTISMIHERLSEFSRDEKTKLLEGRLTPLEWEEYNSLVDYQKNRIEDLKGYIEKGRVKENKIPLVLEEINKIDYESSEELFKYDRRIIENYTAPTDTPVTIKNIEDYVHDESIPLTEENKMDVDIRIQPIEERQIALQEEEVYFTEKENQWLSGYFLGDYLYIKHRLNGDREILGDYMSEESLIEMDMEFPNIKRHMDNAINKTSGLVEPTILYHAGVVDPTLVVGSHGVWKSYISASFQKRTMEQFAQEKADENYWETVIYAPQGTKGVCGNGKHYYHEGDIGSLNQYLWEHEYLLGRNTGYTVVAMDYENHRQVVVLDEP